MYYFKILRVHLSKIFRSSISVCDDLMDLIILLTEGGRNIKELI